MLIPLKDIKIKRRVRKNPEEDIQALMDSMRRYGLMNPVTLNQDNVLIAGRRRYEAAKRLGWNTIDAVILDSTDRIGELELEIEENTLRVPFTDAELMAAYARLERLKNPNIFMRIWYAIVDFFKGLFGKKKY